MYTSNPRFTLMELANNPPLKGRHNVFRACHGIKRILFTKLLMLSAEID